MGINEVSVDAGEVVRLVSDLDPDWIKVMRGDGQGFFLFF